MNTIKSIVALFIASACIGPGLALADDKDYRRAKRWSEREWKEEYRNGACEVKRESKPGEFKREIKCKDGIGARWRGEWKREFRDGRCLVKQEAKRDEFKEEVKCERRKG